MLLKMMYAFLFLVLAQCLTYADGFEKMYSANGTDVWAVGGAGNVFRSFDGGATWGSYPLAASTLRAVAVRGSNVWFVGDAGICYSSANNGESFIPQTLAGGNTLRAISFASDVVGWIGGNAGVLLKTTNGGTAWTVLPSPTAQTIYAIAFSNTSNGWLVGSNGTVMKTADGGASWISTSIPGITRDLYTVDFSGSTVYVAGADGAVAKSGNGGASWSILDFKLDSKSDVNDVAIVGSSVLFIGGGGFIRKSTDGAATFSFPMHPMHGELSDIFFYDANKGWASSRKNNAVLRTTDGGGTWFLPTGTTTTFSWSSKLAISATVRGDAFSINPFNKNSIFIALGTKIYVSYNRGETWTYIKDLPTGGSKVNSFYVSPKDTNIWVAAYGSTDRIVRTTDYGTTWTVTITKNFSEYGMPLEMDGSHPDTLYFGPEDGKLYRSTNFGATWDSISHPGFRSPCDIVVVRDNPSTIWVGDGVTGSGQGQMFRSTNGGKNFSLIYSTTGSEIPTIGSSAIDNNVGYATAWGSGGVMKTSNIGANWSSVATTGSAWGVDVAKDDPNVAMFGVYGGSLSYLSMNAGASFATASLSGANYAIYAYDRGTFLSQQSAGVYKMNIVYTVPVSNTQVVNLISPDGGQTWTGGNAYDITWSISNISNVKLEYRTSPSEPWQTIVASTPGTMGSYNWTCPYISSTQVRVRVSDAVDANPVDISTSDFTIQSAAITALPSSLNFGIVLLSNWHIDTLRIYNNGTAPLVISSVTNTLPNFVAGRTSFTIPAGSSDTLSVKFTPTAIAAYADTLAIVNNAGPGAMRVPLNGVGSNDPTPIQLASFRGRVVSGNHVLLEWTTLSEINNFGFEIQKSASQNGTFQTLAWSFVPGHGTTLNPQHYEYTDVHATPGTWYYRLKQIDLDGTVNYFDPIHVSVLTNVTERTIPTQFSLLQNYPNPFNPSTVIRYGLPHTAHVRLEVFNTLGQPMATIVDELKGAGLYEVMFDAKSLASGIYLYRIKAGSFVDSRKFLLVK